MRASQFHLQTTKETPADAELVSHRLMIRAGMIRKLASGIYTWSPLGLRVLQKVENIVREEMNRAGALEMLMPSVQPASLWQETGRWEEFGGQLLKITDRKGQEFCYGPTHEEVITDFARNEIKSYKQLPVTFYQIQTKFRDETRPRFGVMRAREFLMKDAYSFHLTPESLAETYQVMFDAYSRIFTRLRLDFRAVHADSGAIGGKASQEFHVLADAGEDLLAISDASDYAANVEKAESLPPEGPRPAASAEMQKVHTPEVRTIEAVSQFLQQPPEKLAKTLIVKNHEGELVALVLRGDDQLSEIKAARLPAVNTPELEKATDEEIRQQLGCAPGFIGPVGLNIPVIADHAAAHLADFTCGANEDDHHLTGVNWGRDLPEPATADLREVKAGDPSPDGKGRLQIFHGIEVGHVFQLGTKYSEALNAVVLGEDGKSTPMYMGCYGIGVSRIVAAAIEQYHDDKGMIWPMPIAPFQLALLPMNMHKSQRLREAADALYDELVAAGVEVFYDDRKVRPGFMFADAELLGIPARFTLGERGLDEGLIEFTPRASGETEKWPLNEAVERFRDWMTKQ